VAPAVTSADFAYQTAPNKLTLNFSTDVSASLSAADLVLTPQSGGSSIPVTLLGYDTVSNTATFSIPTPLPDGNYRASLATGSIEDASHNPLASDYAYDIFVLAGDADHDRDVDVNDLGILASNWQQSPRTFAQGDFDYSGTVDVNDLGILASQWQQQLPSAPIRAVRSLGRPVRMIDQITL
jgi:Big-like domain-containing protein